MKILHLAAYYYRTKVIRELVTKLKENNDLEQTVFINRRKIKGEDVFKEKECETILFNNFSIIDSLLYYTRKNKAFKFLENIINIQEYDLIHAHCFFSDGSIAYMIKKIYNIDYILSIRADTVEFFDTMPHAMIEFKKILLNAKKIIFITPSIKKMIYSKLTNDEKIIVENKSYIIPNGINDFWYNNIYSREKVGKENINFLQVSEFIKVKNIKKSIQVVKYLNDSNIKCNLTIIGDGKEKKNTIKYISKNNLEDIVKLQDKIIDKDKLKEAYCRADIFIMLSKKETFGLVYIEAMTQGLPIIYPKNTAVDGIFKEKVGIRFEKLDITKELKSVLENYDEISKSCIKESKNFTWDEVTNKINKLYY